MKLLLLLEMGVEYYKAKILNEIKKAESDTKPVINNTTLQIAQKNTQINTIFENLKNKFTII